MLLFIPVGQCGNQIGCRFWDLALREHAAVNKVENVELQDFRLFMFPSEYRLILLMSMIPINFKRILVRTDQIFKKQKHFNNVSFKLI